MTACRRKGEAGLVGGSGIGPRLDLFPEAHDILPLAPPPPSARSRDGHPTPRSDTEPDPA